MSDPFWNQLRRSNQFAIDAISDFGKKMHRDIDPVAMPRVWYLVKVNHSRISDEHVGNPLTSALTEYNGGIHADTN